MLSRGKLIFRTLHIVGVVCVAGTLTGFAGHVWWFFDLFSHFRVQYFICLCLVAVVLLVGGKYEFAVTYASGAAINLFLLLPSYVPQQQRGSDCDVELLRAAAINVHSSSQQYDLVRNFIVDADLDFVLLMEAATEWRRNLADIYRLYPYLIEDARDDSFSIGLLSRHPFVKSDVIHLGGADFPSVLAEVAIGERRLVILGVHLWPPRNQAFASVRNAQLDAIPDVLKNLNAPVLMFGDFNATPWSFYFRKLVRDTSLVPGSAGRGLQPTWPSWFPPLLIPIDHCFGSQEVRFVSSKVGTHVGSDHYPLLFEFMLVPRQ